MKYGEQGEEEVGEMVNPFDEFTNQHQYELTPLEEIPNPETSDFSDELRRQEKGKLRNIPEIKERTRDGMIDEYTRNLKQWEEILRKAHKSGHYFNMRSAIFSVFKLKDRLRIMEENPNMPPSALRKEFYRSDTGSKVQQIIDSKPSRYMTPGHSPLIGLVEKYLGINQKNITHEVIRRKKATTDEELLKRYPEASVEHKCPELVDGWSSIEDCLPGCHYKKSLDEHQYWEDDDYGRQFDEKHERPLTQEEILSRIPSEKHTKNLRDWALKSEEEKDDSMEDSYYRQQMDLLKQRDKERERY